jgi:hypothetical protein
MTKKELVKDILSNYSKKDIVFIKKSLSDSLKKEKITVEIYELFQHYPKKTYTFYDVKEATKFFDDLRKDAIRNRSCCYMEAYGKPLKGFRICLQILNDDNGKKFVIDGANQDWIYMTDKEIAKVTNMYEFDQKKKNQHLFLDDEGKFLSWVRSNKCV